MRRGWLVWAADFEARPEFDDSLHFVSAATDEEAARRFAERLAEACAAPERLRVMVEPTASSAAPACFEVHPRWHDRLRSEVEDVFREAQASWMHARHDSLLRAPAGKATAHVIHRATQADSETKRRWAENARRWRARLKASPVLWAAYLAHAREWARATGSHAKRWQRIRADPVRHAAYLAKHRRQRPAFVARLKADTVRLSRKRQRDAERMRRKRQAARAARLQGWSKACGRCGKRLSPPARGPEGAKKWCGNACRIKAHRHSDWAGYLEEQRAYRRRRARQHALASDVAREGINSEASTVR